MLRYFTRMRSPTSPRSVGPGTVPLNVHALTTWPGVTSQSVISAVMFHSFTPSGPMVGASSSPPWPSVFGLPEVIWSTKGWNESIMDLSFAA